MFILHVVFQLIAMDKLRTKIKSGEVEYYNYFLHKINLLRGRIIIALIRIQNIIYDKK